MSEIEEEDPGKVEAPETTEESRTITEQEWAEMEELWAIGDMNAEEIAAKYRIKTSRFSQHLYRLSQKGKGIKKGSKREAVAAAVAKKVADEFITTASSFASKRRKRLEAIREAGYLRSQALDAQATKILKELNAGKITAAAYANEIKALRQLALMIQENFVHVKVNVLDAALEVDEGELTKLVFEDLSDREIEQMRSADDDDDDIGLPEVPDELGEEVVEEGK